MRVSEPCRKYFSVVLAFLLAFSPTMGYAQSAFVATLPRPGAMVPRSAAFVPVMLKGMTLYPDNPLRFDFMVDSGNSGFTPDQIKGESNHLVKYFLAAMTVPQNDLWVNLSPYDADRIIPDALGRTELGQDMLAQDYILKQMSSSLLDPEKDLGKEFWARVYRQAQEKFGVTEVPVNTFNKVWIMPEEATVYENGQSVYVVKSRLKVMLDQDYKAQQVNQDGAAPAGDAALLSAQITREIILPEITREVNEGKNFAAIRQIYQALILAKWYKETIKESLLSKVYIDQNRIKGVDLSDPTVKDQIYGRYVEAFKKGVVNLIREDYDTASQQVVPRKYFSGGELFGVIPMQRIQDAGLVDPAAAGKGYRLALRIEPQKNGSNAAMVADFQDLIVKIKDNLFSFALQGYWDPSKTLTGKLETLSADDQQRLVTLINHENIGDLEDGYRLPVKFGEVVVTADGFFHTLANGNRHRASPDFTFKDPYLQMFKLTESDKITPIGDEHKFVQGEARKETWGEVHNIEYKDFTAMLAKGNNGELLFKDYPNGKHNPISAGKMTVLFSTMAVRDGMETDPLTFQGLFQDSEQNDVQIIRIMPWPRSIPKGGSFRDVRVRLKADITVRFKDGSTRVYEGIEGGSQVVLNNKRDKEIESYKIKNDSEDGLDLIVVTAVKQGELSTEDVRGGVALDKKKVAKALKELQARSPQKADAFAKAIDELEKIESLQRSVLLNQAEWNIDSQELFDAARARGRQSYDLKNTLGGFAKEFEKNDLGLTDEAKKKLSDFVAELLVRMEVAGNEDTLYMAQKKQIAVIPFSRVSSRIVDGSIRQYPSFTFEHSRCLGFTMTEALNPAGYRQDRPHLHPTMEQTNSGSDDTTYIKYGNLLTYLMTEYGVSNALGNTLVDTDILIAAQRLRELAEPLLQHFNGDMNALIMEALNWTAEYNKLENIELKKELGVAVYGSNYNPKKRPVSVLDVLQGEFLLITNEQGRYTGEIMPRELVHLEKRWHRAVGVMVIDEQGNFLLRTRAGDKDAQTTVMDISAGGHQELSRSPESEAKREVEESLFDGRHNIDPARLVRITEEGKEVKNSDGQENDTLFVYFMDNAEKQKLRVQEEKRTGSQWRSYEETQQLIHDYAKNGREYAPGFLFLHNYRQKATAWYGSAQFRFEQALQIRQIMGKATALVLAHGGIAGALKEFDAIITGIEDRISHEGYDPVLAFLKNRAEASRAHVKMMKYTATKYPAIAEADMMAGQGRLQGAIDKLTDVVKDLNKQLKTLSPGGETAEFKKLIVDKIVKLNADKDSEVFTAGLIQGELFTQDLAVKMKIKTFETEGMVKARALAFSVSREIASREGVVKFRRVERPYLTGKDIEYQRYQALLEEVVKVWGEPVDAWKLEAAGRITLTCGADGITVRQKYEAIDAKFVETGDYEGAVKEVVPAPADGTTDAAAVSDVGGVDMNRINVNREGAGMDVKFDPAAMQNILSGGVDGFAPVIINLTPVTSFSPVLGLKEQVDKGLTT